MASTEEVLKALQNAKIATLAATEPEELVIDAESRTITVPSSERLFGVTGDMNIERKYFRCPKIVGDNVDLSTHQIFIAYVYTETESGSIFPSIGVAPYHCEDVEVDGEDITFSWKLTGNVFKNPGFILFKMYAKRTETDPNTVFNTTPAIGTVLATIPDGTEEIVEEHPDVIAQIFDRLDALESGGGGGTGGTTNYNDLSNKPQLNGVTLEGNKTLDQVGVLAKNQGSNNSGKFLSVGSDGNVVPADAPSGGGGGSGTPGKDGREIQIQNNGTAIQWRYVGDESWTDLVQLSDITGAKGDPGEDGITPTIEENGNWYLGETDTGKPSRGEKGPAGQDGNQGPVGQTGATPNIQIGTVQTLEPEQQATASMTGTPENPLLNLGIPKGEKGDPGEGSEAKPYELPIMSDTQLGGGKAVEKTDEDVPVAVDPSTGQLFVPTYPENSGTVDPEQIKQAVNEYLDENPPSGGSGITVALKNALLNLASVVVYKDETSGASTYSALESALSQEVSNITLLKISVVCSVSEVAEKTTADELRKYLTVTAIYSDKSSEVVNDYDLEGTVVIGENRFTVTYNEKSATFMITGVKSDSSDSFVKDITKVADVSMNVSTGYGMVYAIYNVKAGDTIEYWANWSSSNYDPPKYYDHNPIVEGVDYTPAQTAYGGASLPVVSSEYAHTVLVGYSYGKVTFNPEQDYACVVIRTYPTESTFSEVGATWMRN